MAQPISTKIRGLKSVDVKDLLSGCFFCGVGIVYGGIALRDLPIGQVFNMGPGFFPLVLCGLLLAIGGVLIVRSLLSGQGSGFGPVPWRAIALISAGIAAFAVEHAGGIEELDVNPLIVCGQGEGAWIADALLVTRESVA